MYYCKTSGCTNQITDPTQDFCPDCRHIQCRESGESLGQQQIKIVVSSQEDRNPYHFRSVEHLDEVDVFAVHHIFALNDPSGALQYASRKLLLSGIGEAGTPDYEDIREARDTLTRWLELNAILT